MELKCTCGNTEEFKTDIKPLNYEVKNCNDGSMALVCKKCSRIVLLDFTNK